MNTPAYTENLTGPRGRKDDPLYKARRTLHTGAGLLTENQQTRLEELFAHEQHVEVEATWGIYQRMVTAYREPDKKLGKFIMQQVIDSLTGGVPTVLAELHRLGRTLKQHAANILAFLLVILATLFVLWLGGRIYERAVLHTGSRMSLKEAMKGRDRVRYNA